MVGRRLGTAQQRLDRYHWRGTTVPRTRFARWTGRRGTDAGKVRVTMQIALADEWKMVVLFVFARQIGL